MQDHDDRNGPASALIRGAMAAPGQAPAGSPSHPAFIPGRGPVAMPMVAPGPGGPGGYNRYREMTLEEMLLEAQ